MGAAVRGRRESARAEQAVAQTIAGLQVVALPVDGDPQLACQQSQMMFEAGLGDAS